MSEYLIHPTRAGDRWDVLAYRYYGKADLFGLICQANPSVFPEPQLPGGIQLRIPIIDEVQLREAPPADDVRLPWQ